MSSSIEWTQETWNPVSGCTRVSAGCDNCYAVGQTRRLEGFGQEKYKGLTVVSPNGKRHFNGVVRTHPKTLDIPLKRKKPTTYFVNSMSDLFHKDVPFEFIDKVFAVMALTPQHTYQILTKRPERMAEYLECLNENGWFRDTLHDAEYERRSPELEALEQQDCDEAKAPLGLLRDCPRLDKATTALRDAFDGLTWPLPNVWLGTSVEDQAAADARIPHLLRCPAAVRFLSCEPLLGELDLDDWLDCYWSEAGEPEFDIPPKSWVGGAGKYDANGEFDVSDVPQIHWVITGGESGPGARPCNVDWIRSIVDQCKASGVPVFVKQLGLHPFEGDIPHPTVGMGRGHVVCDCGCGGHTHADVFTKSMKSRKGGTMSEWPEDLRVREFPQREAVTT